MRKFINVDLANNNNKFWNVTDNGNGTWTAVYGRVGYSGATTVYNHSSKNMAKTIASKIKKGYTEVKTLDGGNTTTVAASNVAHVAKNQIQTDNGCKETARLIELLTKKNQHNILSSTTGVNFVNGKVTTPMGMITDDTIQRARQVLSRIATNHKDLNLVSDYMRLVPMNIGAGKNSRVNPFYNKSDVDKQFSLLDALEAAIAAGTAKTDVGKVFDVQLSLVDEKTMAYIVEKYNRTVNGVHAASTLKPVRAWEVVIADQRTDFEKDGLKVGNIRKLWHGTRTANLLSILSKGLIIPPASAAHCTGRMFGNGLYFSDQSTKSLNYSYGYWGGQREKNCFMFVADVAMGKECVPSGTTRNEPPKGYDSYFAKAGKSGVINNEMIVFRTSQVQLRWLVEFA